MNQKRAKCTQSLISEKFLIASWDWLFFSFFILRNTSWKVTPAHLLPPTHHPPIQFLFLFSFSLFLSSPSQLHGSFLPTCILYTMRLGVLTGEAGLSCQCSSSSSTRCIIYEGRCTRQTISSPSYAAPLIYSLRKQMEQTERINKSKRWWQVCLSANVCMRRRRRRRRKRGKGG